VLAQLFKIRWPDGTFRGGPAFYIQRGLGSRAWGVAFAVFLIFSFGISYEMVQANTIADTLDEQYGIAPWATALVLLALCAPILYGGLKRVAKISEWVAPLMAIVYIGLAVVVVAMNLDRVYPTFKAILGSAFGAHEVIGGLAGSMAAAMLNGVRRGLFSNEAGEGSAPNAASTAQVTHPAKQGLIQSMGVFVDTILVCSATAFMIFNATPGALDGYWRQEDPKGANITITAIESQLGSWVVPVMVVLICVFAGSSLIGNYAYAEVNVDFLTRGRSWGPRLLQTVAVASIVTGSLSSLKLVWNFADITMTGMALINIVAIVLLGRWAFGCLRDYVQDPERPFVATDNANMPGALPTDIWVPRATALT
jgi:amino acid carrier protein